MEQRRARSSENLRSNGRASQRFSEVVSQGPTAIPARADVDAAISSVLTLEQQQIQSSFPRSQPGHSSASNGFPTGAAGSTAGVPGKSAGGENSTNRTPDGMGDGVDGIGGDGSSGGSGGGGGVVGGLLEWALWPVLGTIDALKWAGGTVNDVAVLPVMRMASPWALAGSALTAVKAFTPQRARDLARVAGNLGLNAAGLAHTPAGGELLRSGGQAAGSLSMAVSSPAGRQFLLESATGVVKLAEALDTPEAKNFIKQGAVMAARGMDALGSRHAKIFVKDLADMFVRLVELGNSHEATTMAAEFTVNLEHALEMEHMAGIARRAAADADTDAADAAAATAGACDADLGSIAGGDDACSTSAAGDGGGTGHHLGDGAGGGVDDDAVSVGTPSDGSREGAGGVAAEEEEEQTLDDLVREARLERARHEGGGGGGGGGSSAEGPGDASRRRSRHGAYGSSSPRVLGGGNGDRPSSDDRTCERRAERACFHQNPGRVVTGPIIRQADLAGNRPLRTFRRAGTAPVSPTTPPSDSAVASPATTGNNIADAPRSAPSSPRGRCASLAAPSAASASAPTAPGGPLSQGEPPRERANTISIAGAGFGAAGAAGAVQSGADRTAARAPSSGGGGSACGESDGAERPAGSARPAVEYELDGNARLPRLKSEHIASVLRGQPLGLELQLEPPNEASVDDTVARASRRLSTGGASPRSPRAGGGGGGAVYGVGHAVATASASPGEEGGAGPCASAGRSAAARADAGGWKQLLFACLLLLFAGDGLRHRWKTTLRRGEASGGPSSPPSPPPSAAASRRPPLGRETAGGLDGGGGGGGGSERGAHIMFGGAFLPSTCQHPASGATMAVWATPSGLCLSPALISGDGTKGGGEGSGPGCALSFRLCDATEVVVQDPSGRKNDGRPERREL